jgi:hypothetical protein
MYSQISGY